MWGGRTRSTKLPAYRTKTLKRAFARIIRSDAATLTQGECGTPRPDAWEMQKAATLTRGAVRICVPISAS